jgi:hypothetical protein
VVSNQESPTGLKEFSDGDDYETLVAPLVSLLLRGCGREEIFRAIESYRANHWTKVPPNPEQDWKITDPVHKALVVDRQNLIATVSVFASSLLDDRHAQFSFVHKFSSKTIEPTGTIFRCPF